MPEAPEVYNYYQYIYPKLKNKILFSLNILSGKYTKKQPENFDKINLPSKILNVNLHGKLIFIELENNITIEFSHGMTGFWSTKKAKNSRLELVLDDSTLKIQEILQDYTFTIKMNINQNLKLLDQEFWTLKMKQILNYF
jgi:formamidopyrimidine-DNA glycosylase